MVLDNPELQDDFNFKANLSVEYNKDNVFEELKEMELASKRIDFISSMMSSLVQQDADMNEIPYFNLSYLIKRYGGFNQEDLRSNEREKTIESLEKEGYSKEDSEKIATGQPKKNFKKQEPEGDEDSADVGGEIDLGL
jgi:hypothetical protein